MPGTPGTGTLYSLNYKINSDDLGFNFKLWIQQTTDAAARAICNQLGQRMLYLLPSACELQYAAYSKDGPNRDARIVNDCCGAGKYLQGITTPVPTYPDNSKSCVLLRFEQTDGNAPSRKWGPVPDGVCTADAFSTAVPDVVFPVVGAIPAPGAGTTYFDEFTAFLKDVGTNTIHLYNGHIPGGAFLWSAWTVISVRGLRAKKGGRAFRV